MTDAPMQEPASAPPSPAAADEAWRRVQLARHPQRPRTLDLMPLIFDGFFELHGDRAFGDDPGHRRRSRDARGVPVMVIGHQKGTDTESNILRNFGSPHPEGFRKAQRLMRLADKLGMPIVTFLDTAGAFPGPAAEERGQAEAIASSIKLMTGLQVPIVVIVLGEGGSGGALAIGVGDVVLALENAVYSVISPEGCASILWRSRDEARDRRRGDADDRRTTRSSSGVVDADRRRAGRGRPHRPRRDRRRRSRRRSSPPCAASPAATRPSCSRRAMLGCAAWARTSRRDAGAPRSRPEVPSLRRRIGRILHLPGVPRRPRWSEIWPSYDADDESERGA